MVDRHGEYIEFNSGDLADFAILGLDYALPDQLQADEAVLIADQLQTAAQNEDGQCLQEADRTDYAALGEHCVRQLRASRMQALASRIFDACPDEHLELLIRQDGEAI